MVERVGAGLIGAGFAANIHANAYNRLPNVDVVAVYSRTSERARKFAEEHGVKAWYTDLDEMLERKDIDVVSVAIPNYLHAWAALKAIEYGKNVIIEKPLTTTIEDEEIEKIGMEIAIEYERKNGREPKDVSKEKLGFDIRSKGKDEIRYIEVKARKDYGSVTLTQNEWFKAKRFKEQYWLYVVVNATTKPELYIINNPYENLEAFEKVEVVRFVIDMKEILGKGEKAS
ncbi:TPA: DUF3883 domain-containing protein [Candidatus Bathyarchaeota archaeon]|nr:DUF3883 domain-containing protein [Candidatus Bathyarchaeota archaeon]